MRFPRNTKIFRGQLDAAPFAGVLFVLVIFLLLNTSLVFTPGVPIRLPEAVNLPGSANPTLMVVVDGTGQLYFENQVSDEAHLKEKFQAAVAQAKDPLTLIIQADKEVKYEMLVRLSLLARSTGIKEALLATRPKFAPTIVPAQP